MDDFFINYGTEIKINIGTEAEPEWAVLGNGINNIDETLNEVVQELYFISDKGFGHSEVTGMHPSFTISGNRIIGDPAQDFICNRRMKLGSARKTTLQVKYQKEDVDQTYTLETYQADCTITNVHCYGGDSNNGSEFSCTLSFNGRPTPVLAAPEITITGNNTTSVGVAITSEDDGATIKYKVGSGEWTDYSTALTETTAGSYTIKAKATKTGYVDSEEATATFTVVE